MERFRRLVIIGDRAVSIESPPLTAFLEALQLFADAFESSGGFRLIRIARPPITLYGLYGLGGLDDADQRLLNLTIQRGVLADKLDCFLQCDCGFDAVKCQIALGKILYDVDRAIDLYAVGKDDFGQAERRAAAYSLIIESFDTLNDGTTFNFNYDAIPSFAAPINGIEKILNEIEDLLAGPKMILGGTSGNVLSSNERKWVGALKTYATEVKNKLPAGSDLINDLDAALMNIDKVLDPGGTIADPEQGAPPNTSFHLLDL